MWPLQVLTQKTELNTFLSINKVDNSSIAPDTLEVLKKGFEQSQSGIFIALDEFTLAEGEDADTITNPFFTIKTLSITGSFEKDREIK